MAKPKVKSIEIKVFESLLGGFHYLIGFSRWRGASTVPDPNFSHAAYFRPTAASLARCRRAQEAMVAQKEEQNAG